MCKDNIKKQTILIQGVPINGLYTQSLYFKFPPKKLTVRQVFITDAEGA